MRPAILAFGFGYKFDDIKYFIYSCRLHAPGSDVYVFAGNNAAHLKEATRDLDRVYIVAYREPFVPKLIARLAQRIGLKGYIRLLQSRMLRKFLGDRGVHTLAQPLFHFMSKRFFILQKFIARLPYTHFMFTDIRDVILQGDPFENLNGVDLLTGQEPVVIRNCEHNRRWVLATYAEPTSDQIIDRPILCAGVTVGTAPAIRTYLDEMLSDSLNNLHRIGNMLGADQAIHNRLFYTRLHKYIKSFSENGSGTIATLHFSALTEFRLQNGLLFNRDGSVPAVVHQYDRHPEMMARLRQRIREMVGPHP